MPKKILILAANPKGTIPLRLDEEVREIDAGLQRAKHRDQFVLEQKWAVRPRDIQRAILDINPQIIHFSGHGTGDEGLVFEDETGSAKLVDGLALAGLFDLFADKVKCVVLNGCYSQVQAEAISQHINYVIGISKAIGDRSAIEFAVGFYDALGAGKSVEFAHKFGGAAIRLAGIPEQLTPILKKKPYGTYAPILSDIAARLNYKIIVSAIFLIGLAGFCLYNQNSNSSNNSHPTEQPVSQTPNLNQGDYHDATAEFNAGLVYDNKKDYDHAIAYYSEAIKINPSYAKAYNARGNAYLYKKDYDHAIADYNQVLKLVPNYATAYNSRGNAYLHKKDYDHAFADINQAITLDRFNAIAYDSRCEVYGDLGDYDSAITDCDQAIKLRPNLSDAYYNRGNAYKNKGRKDEAVEDFKKVLELNNDVELSQKAEQQLQELGTK